MCGQTVPSTPVVEAVPKNAVALRTVQQIVQKSAKRLDKKVKGWHKKINVNTLDMHMPAHCIVGQLNRAGIAFGDSDMDEKLGFYLNAENPVSHKGKILIERYNYANGLSHGALLTRLWKHQINKRLTAKKKRKTVSHGC